jgi:integrase
MNVSDLDANTYYEYASFRKIKSGARDVTIRNEISTINHMFKMAYRQGYCHLQELYFRKVKVDVSQEMKRRGIFTLDEYESLWKFMRGWVSKNQCLDDAERQERLLVRDCVLIASNTMLRMGELWQLKWGDIESIHETRDADGITRYLVTINVRHETSKVKRDRTVISRGGEYFLRLKNRSNHTGDDEYVFCSVDGKSRFSKQKYYMYWKMLMNGIFLDYKKRNITWYSLRHFGITCRLKAGVDIYKLAEIAGTSVATIQAHYGHIDREMMKQAALKNIRIDEAGLIEIGRYD